MLLSCICTLFLFHLGPDLPQPDGLVRCHARHSRAVWTGGEEEHPASVPSQICHLEKRLRHVPRVFPDGQLIVTKAVPGHHLPVLGVPGDAGHLAPRVGGVELGHGGGVPDPHCPVHSAPGSGEDISLPRTPGHGLDSGLVGGDGVEGGVASRGPDLDTVVIAATGQGLAVLGPGEPAHLLLVPGQAGHLMLGHPHVMEHHNAVTTSAGQDVLVPVQTTHPRIISGVYILDTELLCTCRSVRSCFS